MNYPQNPIFANPQELLNPITGPAQPLPAVGPQGIQGIAGNSATPGKNGINAYAVLDVSFAVPAGEDTIQITVRPGENYGYPVTASFDTGHVIAIGMSGAWRVESVDSDTTLTVSKYAGNIVGEIVPVDVKVSPSGIARNRYRTTTITYDAGNTSALTLGSDYEFFRIIRPTHASTGKDVTLPDAGSLTGQVIMLYNNSGVYLDIAPAGIQTLNGLTSVTMLTDATGMSIISDGTGWWTI